MSSEMVRSGEVIDISEVIRTSTEVVEEKDRNLIQPLGIVCYDNQRKLASIAEAPDHSLLVHHRDYIPGFIEDAELTGWGDRIAYLDEFAYTSIAQVNLTTATIRRHRSLRGRDMLGATLPFMHANNGRVDNIVLNEEELLRVFVGETGRIVSFEGADRAAETALVVNRTVNKETFGLMFVFHSADYSVDLDSITGLETFLTNYNEQMRDITESFEVNKWMENFEQRLKSGEIRFETTVREHIYRARIISLARLFELTGDIKYQTELTSHLGTLEDNGRTFLSKLFSSKANVSDVDRSKLANDAVNKFIGEGKEKKVKPDNIFRKLKSPYCRNLRMQIGSQFGLVGEAMQSYIQGLATSIANADEQGLDDVMLLTQEIINNEKYRMSDHKLYPNVRGWYVSVSDFDPTEINIIFNSPHYEANLNKLQALLAIQKAVGLRRDKLARVRVESISGIVEPSRLPPGGGGF